MPGFPELDLSGLGLFGPGSPPLVAMAAFVAAFAAAALALAAFSRLEALRRRRRAPPADPGTVFILDGPDLMDATPAAEALLAVTEPGETARDRVYSALTALFPDAETALDGIARGERREVPGRDGAGLLTAEVIAGRLRLAVHGAADAPPTATVDAAAARALSLEVEMHRRVAAALPAPVWVEDGAGEIVWANRAYLDLGRAEAEEGASAWPPPRHFPEAAAEPGGPARHRLGKDGPWFDLHVREEGAHAVFSAIPASAAAMAEQRRAELMQALAGTFSDVSAGLALFDGSHRLILFNPALTDLTGLPAPFLAGRPQLTAVLAGLRDTRIAPEPRDWRRWQARLAELDGGPLTEAHRETWSLPDGRALRVTARPHPGGALALLFEDVSSEVALTRRVRAELSLKQSILDSLDEAIAVFLPDGRLIASNRAYEGFWGPEGAHLAGADLGEAMRHWARGTGPDPAWAALRSFVAHDSAREEARAGASGAAPNGARAPWAANLRLVSGGWLHCRALPIAEGATLLGFTRAVPAGTATPRPKALPA